MAQEADDVKYSTRVSRPSCGPARPAPRLQASAHRHAAEASGRHGASRPLVGTSDGAPTPRCGFHGHTPCAEISVDAPGTGAPRRGAPPSSMLACHACAAAQACGALGRGRVNCTVAPGPAVREAHIRPPCASTIDRQIESPMPMPPGLVV